MKTSIVIPSMRIDLTMDCVNSIVKYTDITDDIEVIVVANGMKAEDFQTLYTFSTKNKWFKYRWYDNGIGAVPAYNRGIEWATGEFVVLLNDDCVILESPKNQWLSMLIDPFQNPKVGITGPLKLYYFQTHLDKFVTKKQAEDGFIVFFCCAIRGELFKKAGLLDEAFDSMVDVDMCILSTYHGYENVQVPNNDKLIAVNKNVFNIGAFPIYHIGEVTVHHHYTKEVWDNKLRIDTEKLNIKHKKTISVVIPTYGNNVQMISNCIKSVIKNTYMTHVEIIVVTNGSSPEVKAYLDSEPLVKVVWVEGAIGFVKAVNLGIANINPESEFTVLLNHDAVILDSPKNQWMEMLLEPMKDPYMGITGPLKAWSEDINRFFVMFFCACIRNKVFVSSGTLDENFGLGGYDDIDFCVRAENISWKMAQVPFHNTYDGRMFHGGFPIYHLEHHMDWLSNENQLKNKQFLIDRYGSRKKEIVEKLQTPEILLTQIGLYYKKNMKY
jgi:GT2 family glycosyltransferase